MPRAIWKGAISFGLVSVPIKLVSATASKRISFHQIDRASGARVRNKRVSEKTGEEVDYGDIVKGFEVGDDTYVTLEPEELEALERATSHTVEISDFVDLAQIDPIYYDASYYLVPDGVGAKPYGLLLRVMRETGRAAIGRVVLRTKEHLCAIRPHGDGALVLHTMLFHDEVVDASTLDGLPAGADDVADKELTMATRLVESLTVDFDPAAYEDTYREHLTELLASKAEGQTITLEEPEGSATVVDLLEALKASVEQAEGEDGSRRSSRKASARGQGTRGKAKAEGKKERRSA